MNEDERGITPANVTSITVEPADHDWRVTIEQGNGAVVKTIELTDWERMWLASALWECTESGACRLTDVSFVDFSRQPGHIEGT